YPGTVFPSARLGALIGGLGDSVFIVGSRYVGRSPATSELVLSMNDLLNTFGGNTGELQVEIRYWTLRVQPAGDTVIPESTGAGRRPTGGSIETRQSTGATEYIESQ